LLVRQMTRMPHLLWLLSGSGRSTIIVHSHCALLQRCVTIITWGQL